MVSIVVVAVVAFAGHARAQTSSTGRALYDEGVELQRRGDCAAAVDRFKQSLEMEWAEPTLLRTAECRAQLGELVAAAGILRALTTPLAAAQLADVERRMPTALVRISPPNATGLAVTIDGSAVALKQLAAPIELDPGEHTIIARDDDHDPHERTFRLAEGQHAEIALDLGATSTALPGRQLVSNGAHDAGAAAIIGGMLLAGAALHAARPSFVLVIGAGAAFAIPQGTSFGDLGLGGTMELDVGARVARYFIPRLHGQGGPMVHGYTIEYDAGVAFMTAPDGFGFFAEVALGARNGFPNGGGPSTSTGIEALVGLGAHSKQGPLQIVPKVDAAVGTFGEGEIHALLSFGISVLWEQAIGRKR